MRPFLCNSGVVTIMDYKVNSNSIIINDQKGEFDIVKTLHCGQVFRYDTIADNHAIISKDMRAVLKRNGDTVTVYTKHHDYFIKYFDLEKDYDKIYTRLMQFPELTQYVSSGYGIRILSQDVFENIVSFIVTPRMNIPKIRQTINNICFLAGEKCSDEFGEFYAFPTSSKLSMLSKEDFTKCGAGYRDSYLQRSASVLNDGGEFVSNIVTLGYEDAKQKLLTLTGVGNKVADCILLFSLKHFNAYPVDTWIYKAHNDKSMTVDEVCKYYMDRYKNLSGYAQQVIFYGGRNLGLYK